MDNKTEIRVVEDNHLGNILIEQAKRSFSLKGGLSWPTTICLMYLSSPKIAIRIKRSLWAGAAGPDAKNEGSYAGVNIIYLRIA